MAYENLSPEELARKFGAKIEGPSPDDAEALARKYGATIHGDPLTPLQAGGAVASGFNRAVIAGVGGLPVDTLLNVADLARAGYGYAGSKAGFLKPDELPQPLDRVRYVGSSAYIADQMQGNPYTAAAINNPRPDDATARLLNAGGAGIGAGMSGRPRDAAMMFASGVAGQGAAELGATPEWSMLASMGPQAMATGGAGFTRFAARGGEQGRQQMLDRMEQFKAAGVEPTVGLATGNRRTQAMESALSKMPGSAGTMAAKIQAMHDQAGESVGAARDALSPVYGPAAAGDTLRRGVEQYRQRQQDIYRELNDRAMAAVPEGMRFPVSGMMARGSDTLAEIPGAPNVSRVVNQPLGFTQEMLAALERDAGGKPATPVPSRVLAENGHPFMYETPPTQPGIPFEGIAALKRRVGDIAYANNPLLADANTGAMKHLYGGAKQDLLTAGALADAERVNRGLKPQVLPALQRGEKFYAQSQRILENVLAPIHKAGEAGSERSFYRVENELRNSGQNVTSMMASLPLEARKQVSATVADRLGRASPGQQNAEGTAFSPQTFLTNWNRITPDAKRALFTGIPNSSHVPTKLDAIAQSAAMMRDANRVYANPSGTAQAVNATGAITGLAGSGAAFALGHVAAGLGAAGTVLGSMALANFGARAMTSPIFVTWLSQATRVAPERIGQHLLRLAVNASTVRDPSERAAMENFARDYAAENGLPDPMQQLRATMRSR